jgi:glutathione S-transferase
MSEPVSLHGYRYSVYNRIARFALQAKGVAYDTVEVDPFTEIAPSYLELHPFGRVPALTHGTFCVFETRAIIGYIDSAFAGPSLQPDDVKAITRMDQVIGIIDSYGYWPMIRQVFAHRVFRPLEGAPPDQQQIVIGIVAAQKVLAVLDGIANEGLVLNRDVFTLADCHLAPVMDYFVRAKEGRITLSQHTALSRWWSEVSGRPELKSTDPNLSGLVSS